MGMVGMGFLLGVIKMFWNLAVVIDAQLCQYSKNR